MYCIICIALFIQPPLVDKGKSTTRVLRKGFNRGRLSLSKPFLAIMQFEPRDGDELFPTVPKRHPPPVFGNALYMCTGSSESDGLRLPDNRQFITRSSRFLHSFIPLRSPHPLHHLAHQSSLNAAMVREQAATTGYLDVYSRYARDNMIKRIESRRPFSNC